MKHPALRSVPKTGVIYVTSEAEKKGYHRGHPDWCNLGQGMPEIGTLPEAPDRLRQIAVEELDLEYAPVGGLREARQAVADYYNHFFRRGKSSLYTWENVALSGGGRASLTRLAASLGNVNLGHFLPDYTAYEELLDSFSLFIKPIPILLDPENGYAFTSQQLKREIQGRGLAALLISNPCNPTGKVIEEEELNSWLVTARGEECLLIFDEFYSHYLWTQPGKKKMFSAASHVEDVNKDGVVIVDGLTKNWRYPGLRTTWTVGPKSVISAVTSAGSFLDGGGVATLQRQLPAFLEPDYVNRETDAIHEVFLEKKNLLVSGLRELGFRVAFEPQGTFYVFASAEGLPGGLNSGEKFFKAALDEKVIVVPGEYFDVNPGRRRIARHIRFKDYLRFSFGPSRDFLEEALKRMGRILAAG